MKMCQALAAEGHEVVLFARPNPDDDGDPFSIYGVSRTFELEFCHRPNVRVLGALLYARQVARRVRDRGQPDLFNARDVFSLAAVARLRRTMIYEVHQRAENPGRVAVERWLLGRARFDQLVTMTAALSRA